MADSDLQKKTLNLRAGDWDFISGIAKSNGLDTSYIVRRLVSKFVDESRAQINEQQADVDIQL